METLKDIFVPYEIVNKLREIHFDEPCIAFYEFANPERLVTIIKKEETFLNKYEKGTFTSSNYAGIGTPTYEQVFKWFINSNLFSFSIVTNPWDITCQYQINLFIQVGDYPKIIESNYYDNYEIAREKLILKLIEIYEQNNKNE